MAYPPDWQAWGYSVLSQIGAPGTDTNLQSLWVWTQYEKPPGLPTQWNNPLNTTQDYPGGVSVNGVGVKAYPDLQAGAGATAQTLTNGYYPAIIANLQQSKPYKSWGAAAAAQVRTWGTRGFANQIAPTGVAAQAQTLSATGSTGPPDSPWKVSFLGTNFDLIGVVGAAQILIGGTMIVAGLTLFVLAATNGLGSAVSAAARVVPQARALPQGKAAKASPSSPPTERAETPPPLSEGAESEVAAARRGEGRRLSPEARAELTSAGRLRRRSA